MRKKNIKTGFFIQVRMNSARLQGKALIPIAGRPLLTRLFEQINILSDSGKFVVATTVNELDNPIVKFTKSIGIECYRGDENDALRRFIGAAEEFDIDIIVRITGDNPLTDPVNIKLALNCLIREELDYVGITGLPLGIGAEVCTLDALKRIDKLTNESIHRESITSYFYMNPDRFNIRILDRSNQPYSRPSYRLTVDTAEDLRLIEQIYQILGDTPSLSDIITLLDSRPDLVDINSMVVQRSIPGAERLRLKAEG